MRSAGAALGGAGAARGPCCCGCLPRRSSSGEGGRRDLAAPFVLVPLTQARRDGPAAPLRWHLRGCLRRLCGKRPLPTHRWQITFPLLVPNFQVYRLTGHYSLFVGLLDAFKPWEFFLRITGELSESGETLSETVQGGRTSLRLPTGTGWAGGCPQSLHRELGILQKAGLESPKSVKSCLMPRGL